MNTAEWLVTRCENCGMMNVIPRDSVEGRICADCAGGPLTPIGYAVLQSKPVQTLSVEVEVKRNQLDRLLDDVAAVHEMTEQIAERLGALRSETKKEI